MGDGLELWLNRYEASLALLALKDRAENPNTNDDSTDKRLYKELVERLSDIITEFDAEQAKK